MRKFTLLLFLVVLKMPLPAISYYGGEVNYDINALSCTVKILLYSDTLISPGDDMRFEWGDGTAGHNSHFVSDITSVQHNASSPYVSEVTLTHNYTSSGTFQLAFSFYNFSAAVQNYFSAMNAPMTLTADINLNLFVGTNTSVYSHTMQLPDTLLAGNLFSVSDFYADNENDSVAYFATACVDTVRRDLPGYQSPGNLCGGTFFINAADGHCEWNAPAMAGDVAVMLHAEEWRVMPNRQMMRIGEMTRVIDLVVKWDPDGMTEFPAGNFSVFPNPVQSGGMLTISSLAGTHLLQLRMLNAAGQIVWEETGHEKSLPVRLPFLPGGVYLLQAGVNGSWTYGKTLLISNP